MVPRDGDAFVLAGGPAASIVIESGGRRIQAGGELSAVVVNPGGAVAPVSFATD